MNKTDMDDLIFDTWCNVLHERSIYTDPEIEAYNNGSFKIKQKKRALKKLFLKNIYKSFEAFTKVLKVIFRVFRTVFNIYVIILIIAIFLIHRFGLDKPIIEYIKKLLDPSSSI